MAQTTITEEEKNGMDIFDILGPVMVGPSSSHTAGAARIGAIIIGLDCVLDYKKLTLNGGTENIKPGADFIPVAGEVTVTT